MAETAAWLEYAKLVGTFIAGGVGGAILNYIFAERKNRIQPVGLKTTVSYVDLPEILKGHGATITLASESQSSPTHFNNMAVIRIELLNSGNKDLEDFKLGINLPEKTEAIGFQGEGDDRYHTIENDKIISTDSRQSQLDIEMKPFHRKNRYVITIIANTDSRTIKDEIKLSKSIPIRFVDLETKESVNTLRLLNYLSIFLIIFISVTMLGTTWVEKKRSVNEIERLEAIMRQQNAVLKELRDKTKENLDKVERRLSPDSVKTK